MGLCEILLGDFYTSYVTFSSNSSGQLHQEQVVVFLVIQQRAPCCRLVLVQAVITSLQDLRAAMLKTKLI